jgi:2,4-dienoyl-CoA reductase (NADPH2)
MVSMNTAIEVLEITAAGVVIRAVGAPRRLVPADSVVVAGTPVADTGLLEQLQRAGFDCHAVGDCTGLGLIAKATHEAAAVAHRL